MIGCREGREAEEEARAGSGCIMIVAAPLVALWIAALAHSSAIVEAGTTHSRLISTAPAPIEMSPHHPRTRDVEGMCMYGRTDFKHTSGHYPVVSIQGFHHRRRQQVAQDTKRALKMARVALDNMDSEPFLRFFKRCDASAVRGILTAVLALDKIRIVQSFAVLKMEVAERLRYATTSSDLSVIINPLRFDAPGVWHHSRAVARAGLILRELCRHVGGTQAVTSDWDEMAEMPLWRSLAQFGAPIDDNTLRAMGVGDLEDANLTGDVDVSRNADSIRAFAAAAYRDRFVDIDLNRNAGEDDEFGRRPAHWTISGADVSDYKQTTANRDRFVEIELNRNDEGDNDDDDEFERQSTHWNIVSAEVSDYEQAGSADAMFTGMKRHFAAVLFGLHSSF